MRFSLVCTHTYKQHNQEAKNNSKEGKGESKSYVSIIGLPDGVQAAKMALLQRLNRTVKIEVDISARTKSLKKIFGNNLSGAFRRLEGKCGGSRNVKITVDENPRDCKITVSGYCFAAQKAKAIIEAAKRGHVVVEIQVLSPKHVQYIQDTHAALISQIRRRNEVTLNMDVDGSIVRITGGKTNVRNAEAGVHNCLQFSYSKNYGRIAINETFAASLRENKFEKASHCHIRIVQRNGLYSLTKSFPIHSVAMTTYASDNTTIDTIMQSYVAVSL